MKTRKFTRTSYYVEENGNEFEVTHEPYYKSYQVHIEGNKAVVGYLVQDEDCEDPFEIGEEGTFVQFDSSYIHYESRPNDDAFKRIVHENSGRVFTISGGGNCHGPGTALYSVKDGPFSTSDVFTKKSVKLLNNGADIDEVSMDDEKNIDDIIDRARGYYIVPEDVTDYLKYAEGTLETYSDWCNGVCFGVVTETFINVGTEEEPEWEQQECGSVRGYIGDRWAEEELEERMKYEISQLKEK